MRRNLEDPLVSGSEEGSYLRLIDSGITQLKAQGPSRTCNESKEEERNLGDRRLRGTVRRERTVLSPGEIVNPLLTTYWSESTLSS